MKLLRRLPQQNYPSQFWLLFWGMLISTAGASMIWPFLMIYVSEKLDLPMTAVAFMMTLNATATLVASFVVGPICDRAGRRATMAVGLIGMGVMYIAMIPAETVLEFAVLMTLRGIFNPLYRVGADAMIADLIRPEQRADAYALSRLSKNVGIALGPAVGGFVASASYSFAFWGAAAGLIAFGIVILAFAQETLPAASETTTQPQTGLKSYAAIFQDRAFMAVIWAFTFTQIGSTIIWVLLGVYAKTNYQVLENQFGFIPMTNAIMVVGLQVFVTRYSKRFSPLLMMGLGGFFYALGVTSVAFGDSFWDFWASMVILTSGELFLVPTATTFVAEIAPANKRGRYMSLYSLTWGVASGIGPVVGGFLNDYISPQAIWFGGGLIGFIGAILFLGMFQRQRVETAAI